MWTEGRWIQDHLGRTLILRGVNVSGSAKHPVTSLDDDAQQRASWLHPESVSFVGKPIPLESADEHFARLRAFGHRLLRLVVTWEAIEHAGPGQYDEAYLAYLRALIEQAARYDIQIFMDPHQDVWSRFTGGDGAPAWTLDCVGIRRDMLVPCGAAIVSAFHDGPLPTMIWPTNYTKLGAATMFTLLFAGNDFAPSLNIDGEPVSAFLQRHYVSALVRLVRALRGLPNVIGYGSMNEPSAGLIGLRDLHQSIPGMVAKGPSPTPFQSMLAAAGFPQEVEVWEFSPSLMGPIGKTILNPSGACLWQSSDADIWRREGVWDVVHGKPQLLKPDYFASVRGRPVHFAQDYLKPFALRVLEAIRKEDSGALLFVEGPPSPVGEPPPWTAQDPSGVVHAGHFYDGMALLGKHYDPEFTIDTVRMMPVFGRDQVVQAYTDQVRALADHVPSVPFLLGEFGIPFDLDGGASFPQGDYAAQEAALDGFFAALDRNLVSGTLWNYTPDNSHACGDHWNGEDLSIYSVDDKKGQGDVYAGGRALSAVVRPYAMATAGTPLQMSYDRHAREFVFRQQRSPDVQAATEIVVPRYCYPAGFSVEISAGTWRYDDSREILTWESPRTEQQESLRITPQQMQK
ncbi:MAG: cellulase family glycosylhydrolase [Myxococcales bacterium]|nr:cellulase family glycosylhydrolase [Myxococcales bacterium]